jgi:hypothetical protein
MFKNLDLKNSLGIIGQCDHYSVTAQVEIVARVPVSRALTGLEERRARNKLEKDITDAIEEKIKTYPVYIEYENVGDVKFVYSDEEINK